MVGWHHRFNGHECEQTPGDSEGQGSLACCSPWGHKESDMTEQLNNSNNEWEVKLFNVLTIQNNLLLMIASVMSNSVRPYRPSPPVSSVHRIF